MKKYKEKKKNSLVAPSSQFCSEVKNKAKMMMMMRKMTQNLPFECETGLLLTADRVLLPLSLRLAAHSAPLLQSDSPDRQSAPQRESELSMPSRQARRLTQKTGRTRISHALASGLELLKSLEQQRIYYRCHPFEGNQVRSRNRNLR